LLDFAGLCRHCRPTRPATMAENLGFSRSGEGNPERDGLSAGEDWIRTFSSALPSVVSWSPRYAIRAEQRVASGFAKALSAGSLIQDEAPMTISNMTQRHEPRHKENAHPRVCR